MVQGRQIFPYTLPRLEVHWLKEKLSHFNLIGNLLNSSYLEEIRQAGSFLSYWDPEKVEEIILNIDKDVPSAWRSYCIPQSRKDLMVKLLIWRFRKLEVLLNDRV